MLSARSGSSLTPIIQLFFFVTSTTKETEGTSEVNKMEAEQKEQKQEVSLTTKALWLLQGSHQCKRDPEAAVALLKQATKANDPEAKWMLGLCFEYGVGTKSNGPHAMNLYKKAAHQKSLVGAAICKLKAKKKDYGSNVFSLTHDYKALPGVCAILETCMPLAQLKLYGEK